MQISSRSSSVYKNQVAGSDTSSQRIRKAIDTAGENTPFELQLTQAASLDGPSRKGSEMPPSSVMSVFGCRRADGTVHIDDIAKLADEEMKNAKNKLDEAFASAGILNSPAVNFTFDRKSQVEVIGDHPQKQQIQKLLRENDGLRHDLGRAMALKENAVSLRNAENFSRAYHRAYSLQGEAAALALSERFMAIREAKSSFSYDASGFVGLFNGKPEQEYLASAMNSLGVGTGLRLDGFA